MRAAHALMLVFALLPPAAAGRFWGESQQGWFWYAVAVDAEERKEQAEPAAKLPIAAPAQPLAAPAVDYSDAPELAEHALLQRRLDNSRVIAIMSPTPANLSRYMYLQREVMSRSAEFADVWQRVLWSEPELDYSRSFRPLNAVAQRNWDTARAEDIEEQVAKLADDYGLFFLFGEDCLHCAQLAAVLDRFADGFSMPVQAVAARGASHPEFPEAWPDNGFIAASGAKALPAVILAPLDLAEETQVVPIAYGPVTELELAERIAVVTSMPVGARF